MRAFALAVVLIVAACGGAQRPRPAEPIHGTPATEPAIDAREPMVLDGRGHPYLRDLLIDLRVLVEYPEMVEVEGSAVGCFRLLASGVVTAPTVKESSGNADLDLSVERALHELVRRRASNPQPVPPDVVETVTGRWICTRVNFGGTLD